MASATLHQHSWEWPTPTCNSATSLGHGLRGGIPEGYLLPISKSLLGLLFRQPGKYAQYSQPTRWRMLTKFPIEKLKITSNHRLVNSRRHQRGCDWSENESVNRWMDKENVVQPHNGILLGHKKEWMSHGLTQATAWMNPENVMLREARHKRPHMARPIYGMCPAQPIHRECRLEVAGAAAGTNGDWLIVGTGFLWWWWKCLGISTDGCTMLCTY